MHYNEFQTSGSVRLTHFIPLVHFYSPENIENFWFCDVFRGCRRRPLAWNGFRSGNFTKNVLFCILVNVFKNGLSEISGRQPFTKFEMICVSRPYHFKFFKDRLPQVLLGWFLNTLTHMLVKNFLATGLVK